MHRAVWILVGITLLGGLARAEPVPGSPLGVAFGEGSRNLDRFLDYIHDLGVTRTKVSFYWHDLEPYPGVYDFSVLDQYLSQLGPEDEALLNIFTSGWCTEEQGPCKGSPLVDCPYGAAVCEISCAERYRAFILALAEHVKEVAPEGIVYWQRDTEPASRFPHYPANRPEEYVELQRIFYETVKSVFPDAIVIGGNHNGAFTRGGEPSSAQFFDYFLANARDYFDALDVRLYEDIYTIPDRIAWFRDRMHAYGYDKPIVSTEQGGPDPRTLHRGGRRLLAELLREVRRGLDQGGFVRYVRTHRDEIDPKLWPFYFPEDPEQAEIYHRMHAADIVARNVVMLASGVEATWWWNLRSSGLDPIFGRMRLMTEDYQPLPGYQVFKRLVHTLAAVAVVVRVETGDPSVYLYRVERADGEALYVAWRRTEAADPYDAILAPPAEVTLPIDLPSPRIIDATGEPVSPTGTEPLTLPLDGMPVYILPEGDG